MNPTALIYMKLISKIENELNVLSALGYGKSWGKECGTYLNNLEYLLTCMRQARTGKWLNPAILAGTLKEMNSRRIEFLNTLNREQLKEFRSYTTRWT